MKHNEQIKSAIEQLSKAGQIEYNTGTHTVTEYRTPMSSTISVNRFDAQQFLAFIEADIRVWVDNPLVEQVLTAHYEAGCKLFNLENKLK